VSDRRPKSLGGSWGVQQPYARFRENSGVVRFQDLGPSDERYTILQSRDFVLDKCLVELVSPVRRYKGESGNDFDFASVAELQG